jgi:cytosine/adenosine deaminase-related metal-dependent hydrolase
MDEEPRLKPQLRRRWVYYPGNGEGEVSMANGKTLIRGACVLTMDDELGTIPDGDVLFEGDRIAAVGRALAATGAEVIDGTDCIVMPGFVDTHRHMWGAMLRGCACYGDLGTYFQNVVFTYGANYTPEDTYVSVRFGLAEAIDAGITTLHAWEHNLQTRQHAEAAIAALRASGLRGRFSYGFSSDPNAGSSFAQGSETLDLEHVLALKSGEFARSGDLLDLGIACRGAEYSQPAIWQREYAWAREQGLPFTTHTMMTRSDVARVRAVSAYRQHGFLGPDHLLVHAVHLNEQEITALVSSCVNYRMMIAGAAKTRLVWSTRRGGRFDCRRRGKHRSARALVAAR